MVQPSVASSRITSSTSPTSSGSSADVGSSKSSSCGLQRQGANDAHPLLLAAREFERIRVGLSRRDRRARAAHAHPRRLGLRPFLHLHRALDDVLENRAVREQVELLEDHGGAVAQRRELPLRGRAAKSTTSPPANATVPASGTSRPLSERSTVVLPEPDGPIRATTSPRGTVRSIDLRTSTRRSSCESRGPRAAAPRRGVDRRGARGQWAT